MAVCAAANAFGTPGGSKYMARADVMPGWLDVSLSGETKDPYFRLPRGSRSIVDVA